MSDDLQSSRPPGFLPGHERFGGRNKGTTNRKVMLRQERLAEAERVANLTIGDFPDGDTLSFLQLVMRTGAVPLASRIECAKIIFATEKAKLAAVAIVDPSNQTHVTIRDLRSEEAQRIAHNPTVIEAVYETIESEDSDS